MWFNVPHRVVQPTPRSGQVGPQEGVLTQSHGTQEIQDIFVSNSCINTLRKRINHYQSILSLIPFYFKQVCNTNLKVVQGAPLSPTFFYNTIPIYMFPSPVNAEYNKNHDKL